MEDQAVKAANEKEVALYPNEYYAAQKAKRWGLGLINWFRAARIHSFLFPWTWQNDPEHC